MENKVQKTLIKTSRLLLRPMADDEIRGLIGQTAEEEMKKAYVEMLEGCLQDPEHRLWYTPWAMILKKEKTFIGDLCFKGPAKNGAVEIGYGIHPEYENRGYTTEAARALIDWAFESEDVFFVEAEAEKENSPSLRVLQKLGFTEYGIGEEGPRFVVARPSRNLLAVFMCFGMAVGMAVGMAFGFMGSSIDMAKFSIGMCVGLAIGTGIGSALDGRNRRELNAAWKHRKVRLDENKQ